MIVFRCFHSYARKKDGTYYKPSPMKSIRAATDRFLSSSPHNKPFSIMADPAFVKNVRKTGKIGGVVRKKPISKEQLKKLFDICELGPADILNPAQLQRTAFFFPGLLFERYR